jgi:FlaA1/EpsC-like NDP-sugar epimerase
MFESLLRKIVAKVNKRNMNKYFRTRIVMALDVMASVAASLITLFIANLLIPSLGYSMGFLALWFVGVFITTLIFVRVAKSYRSIIRYSTLRELYPVTIASLGKEVLMLMILLAFNVDVHSFKMLGALVLIDFPVTLTLLILLRVGMVVCYDILVRYINENNSDRKRVLIYGIDYKSASLVSRLQTSPHYAVKGFICDNDKLVEHKIQGKPIFSFTDEESVKRILELSNANAILFARSSDAKKERERLMTYCDSAHCEVFIVPSIDKVQDGKIPDKAIRKIKIEDLLGRPEIKISLDEIIANFKDKTILVTGAAGSIGSELCRQLATFGIKRLVLYDNAETPLHNIRLELEETFPELEFHPIIGDVRLVKRLDYVFSKYKPEIVFHAAAYKHVPLMEENPCEAVHVNVDGSRNVADKCLEYGVEKMVMISTDKAVNPTNIMGCTKRLAEIYVQSLGLAVEQGKVKGHTKFVTTRFGNVLGSNGSVIPHFNAQIAAGGPVTVTHPDIVRFFMSIPEACRLVMEAATISNGNQICVFDMGKPIKISFLAEQMIKFAGLKLGEDIEIKYTGLRPGEKLYEEVLATKENTIPTDHDSIFIAKVRSYDYEEAKSVVDRLLELARAVEIPDMVRLMKATVPEFKSKNSPYEIYDNEK